MPLKKGSSKKTISKNIKEMYTKPGSHFKGRIKKVGKAKAQKEMIAVAYSKAGKSKRKAKK